MTKQKIVDRSVIGYCQDFTWPTPTNITEVQAFQKCKTTVEASVAFQGCKNVPDIGFSVSLDSCVIDIQVNIAISVVLYGRPICHLTDINNYCICRNLVTLPWIGISHSDRSSLGLIFHHDICRYWFTFKVNPWNLMLLGYLRRYVVTCIFVFYVDNGWLGVGRRSTDLHHTAMSDTARG